MHKEIFKGRYEWSHPLPVLLPTHDQPVGSILREMPTSTAAAPPLPTWLLCTHSYKDTHTHTKHGWNGLKQKRLGAADSHNHTTWEKGADRVCMTCRGRNRGICCHLMKTAAWREQAVHFGLKKNKNFLGILHYYPSIPLSLQSNRTIWTLVLVGNISWSQIIEELSIKWQFSSKCDWFQSLTSACFSKLMARNFKQQKKKKKNMQKIFIHNTVQKFRVCKIFKYFWKMSLMLTKATFIWLKIQ